MPPPMMTILREVRAMPGNSFPAFARCPPPVIAAKDARLVFPVFDRDQFRSNRVASKLTLPTCQKPTASAVVGTDSGVVTAAPPALAAVKNTALSLRQQQHRLYRSARGGVGGSAVDVAKIVARDKPVERHSARHKKIDEARDEVPRSTVALDHAPHGPAALQPRHLEADLGAGASAADQDAGAETSQPVYGKPKHGRHGRRLQCESVPLPVILRISASVSAPRLSSVCVAPS